MIGVWLSIQGPGFNPPYCQKKKKNPKAKQKQNQPDESSGFQNFGRRTKRRVMPESWETNKMSSVIALACCLEEYVSCRAGRENPGKAWWFPLIEGVW